MAKRKGQMVSNLSRAIDLDNFSVSFSQEGKEVTLTPDEIISGFMSLDRKLTAIHKDAERSTSAMMALAARSRTPEKFLDVCSQIERRAKWGRRPPGAPPEEK